MGVKKEVFGKLDRMAKPGAVLATNTSYLDIDEIAAATSRPGDVLGMHFFSPANVMRLLEVVRGKQTSPEVIATASEVGKRLKKVSVVVGNCFGFVGNRMLARRTEAAERLLLDGASPQEVDRALTDFGFRMGPFAMVGFGWAGHRDADPQGVRQGGAGGRRDHRGGALRAEDRERLLSSMRAATPRPDPVVDEHHRGRGGQARHHAAADRAARDLGAADLSDDQRGRAHPRGGDRRAARRHRCDLAARLQLAGLARRADVLC